MALMVEKIRRYRINFYFILDELNPVQLSLQWVLQCLGAGYSIASAYNGAYMTRSGVDNTLVANGYPTSWAIKAVEGECDIYK